MRVKQVLDIAVEQQKKDCDSIFGVVGPERVGKSDFTLNCDDYLNADISSVVVDKNKIGEGLINLKDNGVFHFDEAADGLLSKDAMNKWNKELERLFMICGAKKLIVFFLIPDFFMLSSYFRKHRIRGLFVIYKRGRVCFYDKKKIDKINFYHDKYRSNKISINPCFRDTFPKYAGPLRIAYNEKKKAKVDQLISAFNEKMKEPPPRQETKKSQVEALLKAGWKVSDITKKVHSSEDVVYRIKRNMVTT